MTANASRLRAPHAARRLAAAVGLSVVIALAAAGPMAAVDRGTLQISAPNGASLGGGGSDTVFAARTPAGAKCPGDTAHDAYFVNSYFVPADTAVTDVTFKGGLPSTGLGIISDGAYYGAVNTARDTGEIVALPLNAKWERLDPKTLFPAGERESVWQTGIACVDTNGIVASYWNAELEFTRDAGDPLGFRWRVVDAGSPTNSRSTLLVVLAAAVGLAGVVVIVGRRSERRAERR